MIPHTRAAVLLWGVALGLGAACSAAPWPHASAPGKPVLTPELAKGALLAMMRSKAGKDLGWFTEAAVKEMAQMPVEKEEGGWYAWTGAFRFHPAKALYTLVIRPRPGARAGTFEYRGSFVSREGRWTVTPPKLVRTALRAGE